MVAYSYQKYSRLYLLFYPVLYLFSGLFYLILRIRHSLYDWGILKTYHFQNITTICVGNLNLGGSGKSPMTNYLIELLKNKYKIAVLSRGYGRKTKGFRIVQINDTYEVCGDEPLMYKLKHPDLIVAVCENRVEGIKQLLNFYPDLQIIILDDAFQHRRIKVDINILITEYTKPFFQDKIFPLGTLRDIKSRAHAADIMIISKTPENADSSDINNILHQSAKYFTKDVYFSSIEYSDFYSTHSTAAINPYKELSQYNCILVTGIANPQPLAIFIKEYARYFYHLKFPDHHAFTEKEFDLIKTLYKEWQNKYASTIIVTTEKDAMRLNIFTQQNFNLPLYIAPIRLFFRNDSRQNFEEKILNFIKKKA